MASILLGANISTGIAKKTYRAYEQAELKYPRKLVQSDKMTLIKNYGRGGYVRYDGIAAVYILGVARKLLEDYDGEIRKLDELCQIQETWNGNCESSKGVAPITAKIFYGS